MYFRENRVVADMDALIQVQFDNPLVDLGLSHAKDLVYPLTGYKMPVMVPEGKSGKDLFQEQGLHLEWHAGKEEDRLVVVDQLVAGHLGLDGQGLCPLWQPGQFLQGIHGAGGDGIKMIADLGEKFQIGNGGSIEGLCYRLGGQMII